MKKLTALILTLAMALSLTLSVGAELPALAAICAKCNTSGYELPDCFITCEGCGNTGCGTFGDWNICTCGLKVSESAIVKVKKYDYSWGRTERVREVDFGSKEYWKHTISNWWEVDEPVELQLIGYLPDAEIDEFIARATALYDDWFFKYIDHRICDGHQWRVEITYADGSVKEVYGSNMYPDTWDEVNRLFDNLVDSAELNETMRKVVVGDAVDIFMDLAKIRKLPTEPYDFNRNNKIDIGDALIILMGVAKMIDCPLIEKDAKNKEASDKKTEPIVINPPVTGLDFDSRRFGVHIYDDNNIAPTVAVISSFEELQAYIQKVPAWIWSNDGTAYNGLEGLLDLGDVFFEEKYLAIVYNIVESSGSIGHRVDSVMSNGDITISRLISNGAMTCDMGYWNIAIELDKGFQPDGFNVTLIPEYWNCD